MSNALAVHSLGTLETDIVVDLGCAGYEREGGMEDSILTLVKRFSPTVLYGFDPHPAVRDGIGKLHGTVVITARRAAWTDDAKVGISLQGNCTHIDFDEEARTQAFDIVPWVRSLPEARIVLKVDVEGAEYVLLPHLIEHGLIEKFSRILIEWHDGREANGLESDRESILAQIPVPVEEWQ